MNFFRSILSDDPEPELETETETLPNHLQSDTDPHQNPSPKPHQTENDEDNDDGGGGATGLWSFGDLVKTLTTRSESVLETYRRDLKEFGTGLRKESDLFREVASRAVKELPASLDVGTSAIDGVLKSTADIIAQGKEALFLPSDDSDSLDVGTSASERSGVDSVRYSRFDAQLVAIRSDSRTYLEDPEDLEEFKKWKLGFVVGERRDEIEKLVGESGALEGMYARIVPNEVDDATFWFRYFYKVFKLEQQEETRARLVKRSLSVDDEEDLSWDVDDEEEPQQALKQQEGDEGDQLRSTEGGEVKTQSSEIVEEDKEMIASVASVDKKIVEESKGESVREYDEKVDLKVESGGSKDSNVAVKPDEPSLQEDEDLEWDEIEDLAKTDDKSVSHGEIANKDELRKRLSTVADEEEDLCWDIEDDDDDEPVKAGNK